MRKLTVTLLGLMLTASVQATTHRTFVAASGVDSGTCGPTTPCRTLEYALSQTNDGGEIVITQSGGYGDATGGLVIDKSISIIAEPGVFAALAPTIGAGITIATAGIDVAIKGLTINGRGGSTGINMTNGASLDLDNVTITNITLRGLHIQTPARVTVKHSTFRNMDVAIYVGFEANLLVSATKLTDVLEGIEIRGGTSGTTTVTATDTLVQCSTSTSWGFDNFASPGTVGKMYLDRVTVANCSYGVDNEPQNPGVANVIALSNSFVTGSSLVGIRNMSGNMFLSSGNNHVANNITDTVGTITASGVFK